MIVNKSETEKPLTKSDVLEIVHEVAKEFRAPSEAEKNRADALERGKVLIRTHVRSQQQAKEAHQRACDHRRPDGSSCVAFMTNSDGVKRGVCQHCNRLFVPEMGEEYEREIRVDQLSPLQQAAIFAVEQASRKVNEQQ